MTSVQPLVADVDVRPAEAPARLRLEFVDSLRALAALFVVLCHTYYQPANGYYASRIMNHLGLSYGYLAVDVFIVVSGFCLMLPAARRGDRLSSLGEFFRRRVRRILPPYYACLLLSILFILVWAHEKTGTVWDNSLPLTWQQVVAHLFLVHDLPLGLPGGAINFPLWSIAVEFQLYLVMPLIVWSFRRTGNLITVAWAVAVGLALYLVRPGWLDGATPWYLGQFVMGCLAARLCVLRQGSFGPGLRIACGLMWVAIGLLIISQGRNFYTEMRPYVDTGVGAATAVLLAVLFSDGGRQQFWLGRALNWKPLVAVGLFSYSLYLVHAPLLHAFDRVFVGLFTPGPVTRFLLLVCMIPCIVGIAYLFHLAFERPFLNMRPDASKVPVRES
jgi:peptidoglycan/LPS O-acetylase OafA/YrhL